MKTISIATDAALLFATDLTRRPDGGYRSRKSH
jgi:hypothetical protein